MNHRHHPARRRFGIAIGSALLSSVCVLVATAPAAHAIPPPVFPDGTTRTQTFTNTTPVTIPTQVGPVTVHSTISVAGLKGVVWDVDVRTDLRHSWNRDVEMTLDGPNGVFVTLTTDNGDGYDNVFDGTVWDDDADPGHSVPYANNSGLVTDHVYANNVLASPLVPEESLGAFQDGTANGDWTLTIHDAYAPEDGGTLDSWAITITTIPHYPAFIVPPEQSVSTDAVQPISATGTPVVTSTIPVTSPHHYLCDVSVRIDVQHSNSADLDISVKSPSGTSVTLTTDNGGSFNDVFDGTSFGDQFDGGGQVPYTTSSLASDHVYDADRAVPSLVPEESLGAFQGEDPNGVWTLTVSDDTNTEGGSLVGWKLQLIGCELIDEFKGLTPTRVLDTRQAHTTFDHLFEGVGPVSPDSALTLQISGRAGVPSLGAGSVALNVTAVDATAATYITVYPAGQPQPLASNLNAQPGQTVPNMVIVPLGYGGANDGKIVLYNHSGSTHLIVDVLGWMPRGLVGYQGLVPARVLETRPGLTTIDGLSQTGLPVSPHETIDIRIADRGGLSPVTSGSVALNVTAVTPSEDTYITVFPTGSPRPLASNLNASVGSITPNMVIVPLGTDGKVSFYNNAGSTDLVVDVLGYFSSLSSYLGLTPARLLDTRGLPTVDGLFQTGSKVGAGGHIDLTVADRAGVGFPGYPVRVIAVNVTITNATAETYVTVYPTGVDQPSASNLNVTAGVTIANMVLVPVGSDGKITIYNNAGSVDVLVDVLGWVPVL